MISIIGAGPSGNYLAYLLSKNADVSVFEEHKEIGNPIQCTGILTLSAENVIKMRSEFMVNTVKRTRVFSPSGEFAEFKLNEKNFILDRQKFDSFLASEAENNGAKIHTASKFNGCELGKKIKMKINDSILETDYLVGADGPASAVARSANLYGKRAFVVGHQARVHLNSPMESDLIEFYLFKDFFGWIVPEDEYVVRTGVACKENANIFFNQIMAIRPGKIIGWQSGAIPVYNPKIKTEKENVFLVGDAATQVKATTYGGILQGLLAAKELSRAILENKSYEKLWKKEIGKELYLSLMIRKVMDRFSDEDFNYLLKLTNQERIKKIIDTNDRDYPSRIIFKLFLREPRFLKFSTKLIA